MMTTQRDSTADQALAFVNYRYFRTSPENRARFAKAYYYTSKRRRVVDLVGDSGTLWVVTSRLTGGPDGVRAGPQQRPRREYSLAYRLRDCEPFAPTTEEQRRFGDYGVLGDVKLSEHFPSNDVTDVLLTLDFVPRKPIRSRDAIGMSLMTARRLAAQDVARLERFADRVLHGQHVFISYARADADAADRLERVLDARSLTVWRDIRSIVGGAAWEQEIRRAIRRSAAVVVLVSAHAATSDWVRTEVAEALEHLGSPGGVQRVVPVLLEASAAGAFPELEHLQARLWDGTDLSGARQLAAELRGLAR